MSAPMTDADLLEYIERTPELEKALMEAHLYSFDPTEFEVHFAPDAKAIARAFHANEQRVRADEREACARVCDDLRDEDGYEAWNTECAAAIRARKGNA